jgi:hypothetical protein
MRKLGEADSISYGCMLRHGITIMPGNVPSGDIFERGPVFRVLFVKT